MSRHRGLPVKTRMRHDAHFVEELATQTTEAIGRIIPLEVIRPNPEQPRQMFDGLEELVDSISKVGVLQPLLVRRLGDLYQIVSGERRYRASGEAGLEGVPCIVLEVDDAHALEIALIENLQRQDLSPFEEAEGLQALVNQFGYTHGDVSERISKSRTTVTEILTLATVPTGVRNVLEAGQVRTKSILLEVARQGSEEEMLELATRIVEEGLTRDGVRALRHPKKGKAKPADKKSPDVGPRRLTYRSQSGVTVTLFIKSDSVSLTDLERALLEALRQLRSTGLPEWPAGTEASTTH